jgi:hypothetical protein
MLLKHLSLIIAAGFAAEISTEAQTNYDWNYTGGGVTGSGVLTTESTLSTIDGNTGYLVSLITGTIFDGNNSYSATITGISTDDYGTHTGGYPDNLLLETTLQPDATAGLEFATTDNNSISLTEYQGNIVIEDNFGYINDGYSGSDFSVDNPTPTPEPGTLALAAIGIAIGGAISFRRRKY